MCTEHLAAYVADGLNSCLVVTHTASSKSSGKYGVRTWAPSDCDQGLQPDSEDAGQGLHVFWMLEQYALPLWCITCMHGSQASELDLQTEMATTGSLTHARALMVDEAQEPSNTTRRAQSTLPKSVVGRFTLVTQVVLS